MVCVCRQIRVSCGCTVKTEDQLKLPLPRGESGGRNGASNTALASLMNCRRGWTCGVGRLSAKREDAARQRRGIAITNRIAISPNVSPSVYIRAACCSSAFRSRTRGCYPVVSSGTGIPDGAGAGRDGWWRSKGEIRSTKTRRG